MTAELGSSSDLFQIVSGSIGLCGYEYRVLDSQGRSMASVIVGVNPMTKLSHGARLRRPLTRRE